MVDGANQTFYSATKNAKFSVFKTCKMAVAGQNTRRPPARPENYCESKQTYFSYSLDEDFHSPEFQAKLFFTRNWVDGFYWDSLLNLKNFSINPTNPVALRNRRTLIKQLSKCCLSSLAVRSVFPGVQNSSLFLAELS